MSTVKTSAIVDIAGGNTVTINGDLALNQSTNINSGVAVSASSTAIDFTDIPSWVKRITIMVDSLSTNGTSPIIIQLGDSGGIENTGYEGSGVTVGTSTVNGTVYGGSGFFITNVNVATYVINGGFTIANLSGNSWMLWGSVGLSNTAGTLTSGGKKTLSSALDRIRITTVNGTDAFDGGVINIMWE